ncbi:hypothetical protein [Demequina sp. NBRC 110051]|nr:hypothetical protein [Demequina sp. NBRC 110051]
MLDDFPVVRPETRDKVLEAIENWATAAASRTAPS